VKANTFSILWDHILVYVFSSHYPTLPHSIVSVIPHHNMWLPCHHLKYKLENTCCSGKVLCTIDNFRRCTLTCELHVVFNIPYVWLTQLCSSKWNAYSHLTATVHNIGQDKAVHRKYKRLTWWQSGLQLFKWPWCHYRGQMQHNLLCKAWTDKAHHTN